MSRKQHLEELIRDSYKIIYGNNLKIQTSEPREKVRLERENEEQWD